MRHNLNLVILSLLFCCSSPAQELRYGPVPFPVINPDTWVLIEVWPTVHDITLSAYFLDISSRKNQNLCEATKRALGRDAEALAKTKGLTPTSYRECYTLRDAIAKGYIAAGDRDALEQ